MGSQAQNDIESLKRKFEGIQTTVVNLETTINNLIEEGIGKDEIKKLQDQIDTINETLGNLTDDIEAAITDSETIKQIQADIEEIQGYDPSLIPGILEIINNTDLENLPGKIKKNADDIATLRSEMDTAKEDISDLKTRMDTAETDIDSLESDVATIKTDIASIKTQLAALSMPWIIRYNQPEPPTDPAAYEALLDSLPPNGLLITKEEDE